MRTEHHRRLAALLRAAMPSESVAFVLCRRVVGASTVIHLADEVIEVADADYASRGDDIASVTPLAMARVAQRARAKRQVVVMAHLHPMTDTGVEFSAADFSGNERSFAFLHRRAPQPEHVALVWNAQVNECRGLVYTAERRVVGLDAVNVVDGESWLSCVRDDSSEDPRFHRQAMLLGALGQRLLGKIHLLIAGAGGTGSLAAMGALHHGIRKATVIDDQKVDVSNLPRIVGAQPCDVDSVFKTAVAARYGRATAPDADLVELRGNVEDPRVLGYLIEADAIVCCTDNTTSRAHLNQVSQQYLVPLLEIGVQFAVSTAGQVANELGRINLVRPGSACLACSGHIDPARLAAEATPRSERETAQSYLRGFGDPQPSMLAFNMEIVGRALQVLLGFFTGVLRTPCDTYEQRSFFRTRGGTYVRHVAKRQASVCSVCGGPYVGIGEDAPMQMRQRAA